MMTEMADCPLACEFRDLQGIDLASSITESAVLIAAFVVGWCLFRPLLAWPYRHLGPIPQAPRGGAVEGLPKRPQLTQERLGAGEFPEPGQPQESQPCPQDFAAFTSSINAVRRAGGTVEHRTLRAYLRACAQRGMMDQAAACFTELAEGPDERCFSILARGFCSLGQLEKAMSFLDLTLEHGLRPDAIMMDALLESCLAHDHLTLAEKVLSHVKSLQLRPSSASSAVRIRLCTAKGDLAEALRVYEEMFESFGIIPNAYVHGLLISSCYHLGETSLALEVYRKMLACGCQPDARSYECLVRSCCAVGHFEEAMALVYEALGLTGRPRSFIDKALVEELLATLLRRGEARRLGLPFLARLQACDFAVSERLAAATAPASIEAPCSERHRRRSEFQRWRDLPAVKL